MRFRGVKIATAAAATAVVIGSVAGASAPAATNSEPPALLSQTGLYTPGTARAVDPQNLTFSPQYPLWTDGAHKRRWIRLPAGSFIDASQPDAWRFPVGTRLWKEFSFDGKPVETRMIERLPDEA